MEQDALGRYRVSPLSERHDFKNNMNSSISVPPPPITRFSEPAKLEVMKRRARRASCEMTAMRAILHKGLSRAERTKPRITSAPIKLNSADLSRLRFSMLPRSAPQPGAEMKRRAFQTSSLPQSLCSAHSSALSTTSHGPRSACSVPGAIARQRITSMPIILSDQMPEPAPVPVPVHDTYTSHVLEHAPPVLNIVPSTPSTSTTYYTSFSVSSSPFSTPNASASSSEKHTLGEPFTPSSKTTSATSSNTSLTSSPEQSYHTAKSHISIDSSSVRNSPESIISSFIDSYGSDSQSSDDSLNSAEMSIFSRNTQNSLTSGSSGSFVSMGTGSVFIHHGSNRFQRFASLPGQYMHKPLPKLPSKQIPISNSPLVEEKSIVEDLNAECTSIFIDPNESLHFVESFKTASNIPERPNRTSNTSYTEKHDRKHVRKSYGSIGSNPCLSEKENRDRRRSLQYLRRSRIDPFMLEGYQDHVSPRFFSCMS